LTSDWTYNEVIQMRDEVPAQGLATKLRNRTLREVAREVLEISRSGLAARNQKNREGYDETGYLAPLEEIVARGSTSAEEMVKAFHTRWGGSIEPVFLEFAY